MNLVILAAGMGSRFGGLKQIEPIDDAGNFIIDYSIFDAIKAGFDKVVFVIKKENFEDFRATVGKRIERFIKVEYAFQEPHSFVPERFKNSDRKKPWGTAHALLCAGKFIDNNFAVINADDFYGRGAFEVVYDFFKTNKTDFAMVGYKVGNTLTEFGSVKRGVCKEKNGNFLDLIESEIRQENGKLYATPIGSAVGAEIHPDNRVSLNFFGLRPVLFDFLQKQFEEFLEKNQKDLSVCEFFMPTVIADYVKKGCCNLKILKTDEKFFGLTYKQDFQKVFDGLKNLKEQGKYPCSLWK